MERIGRRIDQGIQFLDPIMGLVRRLKAPCSRHWGGLGSSSSRDDTGNEVRPEVRG